MKICSQCRKNKEEINFNKDNKRKDGLCHYCKQCKTIYHKKRYLKIKNKIIENNKKYYKAHKKYIIKRNSIYFLCRRKTDIKVRILDNLRRRINNTIHRNTKSNNTLKLLGCSVEFLKNYLEKKFTKGMSWNNYGKWHIDHIKPCASFELRKPEEQRKCFNYQNLQPLWAKDNLKKSKY